MIRTKGYFVSHLSIVYGLVSLVCCFFLSCATTPKEYRLDPASEEFLSHVRYIITQEEQKIFLELPPSARAGFIEEFWGRRDPDPETPRNEYKEAYYQRMEEANHLFRGGGRPGWLQDRGRIYVLFGRPNERQTQPMGGRPIDPYEDPREMIDSRRVATGEKPSEVWVYYNLFSSLREPHAVRIVFVDSYGTGDYRLATNLDELIPGGIDSLLKPNLGFLHELHKEEAARAQLTLQRALFDFSWEFIKQTGKGRTSNLLIHITLPYRKIIFREEDGRMRAKLELEILVREDSEEVLWEQKNEYELDFSQDFLKANRDGAWKTEIPVLRRLEKGRHSVYLGLRNVSGDQEIEKLLPLNM